MSILLTDLKEKNAKNLCCDVWIVVDEHSFLIDMSKRMLKTSVVMYGLWLVSILLINSIKIECFSDSHI